jgi:hypothetical protein
VQCRRPTCPTFQAPAMVVVFPFRQRQKRREGSDIADRE